MRAEPDEVRDAKLSKPVSGKKVVIGSLLGFTIFTAVMGYGTYELAQYLAPILKARNERQMKQNQNSTSPTEATAPSQPNRS